MNHTLKTYNKKDIDSLITLRKPGIKFGEKISYIQNPNNLEEEITASKSKYVLLGVPEDAGVIGNYGVAGARFAWHAALKALLNIQHNRFCKGRKLLLLGYLDFKNELKELDLLRSKEKDFISRAREITAIIDKEVTFYIRLIIACGKKPIIVGGGHNNCYGIIKGVALARNQSINSVNIDAHTDLRTPEGRHSGNGFSYALREGFLNKYFIYGVHENYLSTEMLKKINSEASRIQYKTYEELKLKKDELSDSKISSVKNFVKEHLFGLEVDCDAIINIPSSAMTPSGFSVLQIRKIIYTLGKHKNIQYLHICEAAPDPENKRELTQTGKLIAYLISDFIRK
jgi:formiminoglutamase